MPRALLISTLVLLSACVNLNPDPKETFERELRPLLDRSDLATEKLNGDLLVGSLCFLAAFTFEIPISQDIDAYLKALQLEPTSYDGGMVLMAGTDIRVYVEQAGFAWSEIVDGSFHGTKDGPMFPVFRQRLYPEVTAYKSKTPYVQYVFIDRESKKALLFYFSGCAG